MAYTTEEILRGLKEAREAKGLGQRDLGARIGMLQSHISKIESGRSDIRLSSQIGFARALDLDLRLVPRAAVPVVEEVVRSTISPSAPPGLIDAAMAVRGLDRALDAADRAQALFPNLEPLEPLGDSLQSLRNRLQGAGVPVRLSAEIRNACAPIHKQLTQIRQSVEPMTVLPPEIQESLTQATVTICRLSHRIPRGLPSAPVPRPTYRFDGEADDHG